jgi:DegV family protein with EDD domain
MIAIVTDSTCDLPETVAHATGVRVIPAILNVGQQTLRDGLDLSRDAFYEWLPKMPSFPKTSAPGPGAFIETYEALLHKASHIVSVHVSGKLSGICNAARLAAQQVAAQRIHVVDSGQVSMGLGWAALAAADAVRKSETLEGVLHSVADTLARVKVYATLHTLEFLARSGRVNMVQLGLGTLLSLKPIVELREGVVSTLTRVRTWSRAVADLAERTRALAPIEKLAIMHTHYADGAADFLTSLCASLPCPPNPLIVNATTVIGAHVGPHALGIAAVVGSRGK